MENKFKITALAMFMALCPAITMHAQMNIADMDEEDWMNSRDTTMLSRINRTIGKKNLKNASQYIVNDTYQPENEDFSKKYLMDNLYVGASMGFEYLLYEPFVNKLTTLTDVNVFVGKEFTTVSSARLSLSGSSGFTKDAYRDHKLLQVGVKGDYLYNLTNKLCGYSSTRRLEISLLGGLGFTSSHMEHVGQFYGAEAHAGMQFKIYTGPFGSIAIEPFAEVANDKLDMSGERNWRGFDWRFGITGGYMFYTQDNLSRQSRLMLLKSRLETDRLIDSQSLESWRTPWFAQYGIGAMKCAVAEGNSADGKGNITNLMIGRWMSPVIGMRGGVGSRMSHWYQIDKNYGGEDYKVNYGSHYYYGRVDWLFNPLGFLPTFSWDAPYGGYLFGGLTIGNTRHYRATAYDYDQRFTGGYTLGANLWYRLSSDLQVFVEPFWSREYYEDSDGFDGEAARHRDTHYGVQAGLTLMMRTKRYRDDDELDDVQEFNYRNSKGVSIGVAGGGSVLQRRSANYGHDGFNFNYMAFAEYRLNELHAVRLSADVFKLNANYPTGKSYMSKISSSMLVASLNYQCNLTNLLSGRFVDRSFSLEGFIGPAYATVISGAKRADKNGFFGFDFGFKLMVPVTNGISAILQPTVYGLGTGDLDNGTGIPGTNPVGFGYKIQFYEDITVGLQFDTNFFIDKVSDKIKSINMNIRKNWKTRQSTAIKKYQYKQQMRLAKRHAK